MAAKKKPSVRVSKPKASTSTAKSKSQITKSKPTPQARTKFNSKLAVSPSSPSSPEDRSITTLPLHSINQEGEEEEEEELQGKEKDPSSPLSISASQTSTIAASQSTALETVWRSIAKANHARRTQKRQEVYKGYTSALDRVVQQRAGRWMGEGEEKDRVWRKGVVNRIKEALKRKQMLEVRIAGILKEWDWEIGRVVGNVKEGIKAKKREEENEEDMDEYEEEEKKEGGEEEEGEEQEGDSYED